VAEELHASDYQVYAYLQTGQDAAALKLIKSLSEIKSRFDPKLAISGAASPASGYYAMAAIPARYALERQDWKSAAAIEPDRTPIPYADAISWFARGLGAARLKQIEKAQGAAHELQSIVQKLSVAHEVYWMGQVSIQEQEVNAWAELASGNNEIALKTMNEAAKAEDATDKSAVTPGPLAPARELLGEMFLQMGEPKLALEQFELTLKKEPGRFRSLYGAAHAAKLVGDKETSRKYSAKLLKSCERGDRKIGVG